jgi:hypothetical protein
MVRGRGGRHEGGVCREGWRGKLKNSAILF